jgi:aromatic-L-amino-acid/L-tryptophan decarboxylase
MSIPTSEKRTITLEMSPDVFRDLGYQMVDRVADLLGTLRERPVTPQASIDEIRSALGQRGIPQEGTDAEQILHTAADLLFAHSTFNGHPRFWGYITAPAAPIGILADLLAAGANPNVGGWHLAPVATEIEGQAVRWIAEMLGYEPDCGGLFMSGGNMANIVGVTAARRAKASLDVREQGLRAGDRKLRLYTSKETHTWVEKAADILGLGTGAIRWIPTDDALRMDTTALRQQINADIDAGDQPFLVIGTGGTVSTSAIDPLPELAAICREHDLWFHVDGAYGGFAAMLPDAPADLLGLREADSVAIDPHKWLYAPLEAGCVLVRDAERLRDAYSVHPPSYYHFDDEMANGVNYYEYGPQNSRGFRAFKVWLAIQQVGRRGYERMLADDIGLARSLFAGLEAYPELQPLTQGLSITTFRYIPADLTPGTGVIDAYLNALNEELVSVLQRSGEAFISNAVIGDVYALRACVVNFRTTLEDILDLPEIVLRHGEEIDRRMRPADL